MIVLGDKVRDSITGFAGVVVGYVHYITGCNQALIQPAAGKDGTFKDSVWLDEQRLVVDKKSKRVVLENGANPGFDKAPPKR